MSWRRMPSRRAIKVMAWAIVVVATAAVIIAWVVPRNDAKSYLNQVTVAGFVKVAQQNGSSGAGPWAEALFVGPPTDEIRGVVSAPGLTLGPAPTTPDGPASPSLLLGEKPLVAKWVAYGDATNGCHVSIDKEIENPYYEDRLTSSQLAGMRDGSIGVFLLQVTCGKG
ncbi:hypothetical protein [Nocardia acidivorans]|uniref:hypothetical protein n=1 Tax=Nocardia acidivorans TaxID=404580 RepID=UPI0012FB881B|nr:hypothetical protein [Nocardia acidivorans]